VEADNALCPQVQEMNFNTIITPVAVAVATLASAGAIVNYVELQTNSPGTAQTGNIHVTGTVLASKVGVGTASSTFPLAVMSTLDTTGIWSKTAGTAITGQSTKAGTGYGGYFSASGTSARAVFGEATSLSGAGYGGYFVSRSLQGTGVYGYNPNTIGINYGVRGRADGGLSWAGYFEGRGFFAGEVGIGSTAPDAGLQIDRTVAGIGLNANDLLYTNETSHFVGVGRSNRISGNEVFGLDSPIHGFGGMYIKSPADGIPFYGYSAGGNFSAYHYYDPSRLSWILSVNNQDKLFVDTSGRVGIGVQPTAPLDVMLGLNKLQFVNESGLFPGINSTGTGPNAGLISPEPC